MTSQISSSFVCIFFYSFCRQEIMVVDTSVFVYCKFRSDASFGKGPTNGQWANLKGAHFEGALVSSSDVKRMCQNPTLSEEARDFELGC